MRILIFVTTIFAFLIFFSTTDVRAATSVVQNIVIDQKNRADFYSELTIYNSDKSNVIQSYELAIPLESIYDLRAELDGKLVDYKTTQANSSTVATFNFDSNAIRPNQTKTLKISFSVNNAVKNYGGNLKIFYLPNSESSLDDISISTQITFPKNLGEPAITGNTSGIISIDDDSYGYSYKNSSPIYLVWGENSEVEISTSFALQNSTEKQIRSYFEIPYSNNSQTLRMTNLSGILSGVKDNLGNTFALLDIDGMDQKHISYAYKVSRIQMIQDLVDVNYSLKQNINSPKGKELLKILDSDEPTSKKLFEASSYLMDNFVLNNTVSIDSSVFKNENLLHQDSLNRVEYSLLIGWICDYLDLDFNIMYGYILSDDIIGFQTDQPTTWVLVQLDEEVLLFDPYMSKATDINLLGLNSDIDRVTFGIWNPESEFKQMLGLIDSEDYLSKGVVLDNGEIEFEETSSSMSLSVPKSVKSGFPFLAKIFINNGSNKLLTVSEITVNSQKWEYMQSDLVPVLLPGENRIDLNEIREPYFFYEGNRTFTFKVYTDDSAQNLFAVAEIKMSPTQSFWIVAFVIVNVILAVLLLLLYRKRREIQLLLTTT